MKKYFAIAVLFLCVSCNRIIYEVKPNSKESKEKIELLKGKLFTYNHKFRKMKLECRGQYKIEENNLILTFERIKGDLELMPINEGLLIIEKIKEFDGTRIKKLKAWSFIEEIQYKAEMAYVGIAGYAKGVKIVSLKSDKNGEVGFETNIELDEIRLSYGNTIPIRINLDEKGEFEIEVTAEVNSGRSILDEMSGCLGGPEGPTKSLDIVEENGKIKELISTDLNLKEKKYYLKK